MAKTKTLTKAPALTAAGKNGNADILRGLFRFNKENVIGIEYHTNSEDITITKTNDITEETKVLETNMNGGQGSVDFGSNVSFNIAQLFHRLATGNYVGGSFTLSSYLPNVDTTIVSTGLTTINGFCYIDITKDGYINETTPEYGVFAYYQTDGTNTVSYLIKSYKGSVTGGFITRGTYRFENGDLIVKAEYNKSPTYTPFYKDHTYNWVAW